MTAPATLPPPTRTPRRPPRRRPPAPPAPKSAMPAPAPVSVPPLHNGDRLDADEFLRRYEAMPELEHAELIAGKVYLDLMPVRQRAHSYPHNVLGTWLGVYHAGTPGTETGDNGTCRLGEDDVPQPDLFLRILEACGGNTRLRDDYVVGGPEFVAEVAASSVAYDLHEKLDAYRTHGVREYLVWRTEDAALDWFALRGETEPVYEQLNPGDDGLLRSEIFPGLWLDPAALLEGDMKTVLERLNDGLATPAHAAFAADLATKLDAGEAGPA